VLQQMLLLRLLLKRREPTEPPASQLVGALRVETLMSPLREPRRLGRSAANSSEGERSIVVRITPRRYGNSHAISDHTVLLATRQR